MNSHRKARILQEIRSRRALHKLTGRRVPKRPPKRLPRQIPPKQIEIQYFGKIVRGILAYTNQKIRQKLLPALAVIGAKHDAERAKLDASDPDLSDILDEISDDVFEKFANDVLADTVQPVGEQISNYQRAQLGRQLVAGLGVDPVRSEPWLQAKIDQFTRENVTLIRSLPTEYLGRIEKKLTALHRDLGEGDRWETAARVIVDEEAGISEARAARIARDQAGKLYGELNEQRQTDLGINRFVWRTVEDSRVRPEHEERDGETYEWADPPVDEQFGPVVPGQAINCRCWAEPVLSDVFEALDVDTTGTGI